jgi:Flp pilus assembly protein TadD
MGHLADAQTQIQTAARLTPLDPEVGLEAGVIAMLSGHEDAARKSWESTVKASPQSEAGHQASAYLQQIGGTSGANAPSPSPTTGANSTSTQPSPG